MRSWFSWSAIVAIALLTASCGLLDPQQQRTALQAVESMLSMGTITPEQAEGLRQAILGSGQAAFWQQAALVVGSVVASIAGVRLQRGAPTQKVGLPASMVKPATT